MRLSALVRYVHIYIPLVMASVYYRKPTGGVSFARLSLPRKRLPARRMVATRAQLDFKLFHDVTAPILKAGFAGMFVYFTLQWNMYITMRKDTEEARKHDAEDKDHPKQQ